MAAEGGKRSGRAPIPAGHLSTVDAAVRLGITPGGVMWALRNGKLRGTKSGPGPRDPWWIPEDEVERYFKAHAVRVQPDDEQLREPSGATPPPKAPTPRAAIEITSEPIEGPSFAQVGLCARWDMKASEVLETMRAAGVRAHRGTDDRLRFRHADVLKVEQGEAFRRRLAGMGA